MEYNSKKLNALLNSPTVNLSGVAKVSGVSPSYLTELKKDVDGVRDISARYLGKLASALGQPISYFYEENPQYSEKREAS